MVRGNRSNKCGREKEKERGGAQRHSRNQRRGAFRDNDEADIIAAWQIIASLQSTSGSLWNSHLQVCCMMHIMCHVPFLPVFVFGIFFHIV